MFIIIMLMSIIGGEKETEDTAVEDSVEEEKEATVRYH